MPRIDPDRTELHGFHQDLFWPGEIHSVWNADGWLELRRERKYNRPLPAGFLIRVAWQLTLRIGPYTAGWRWEVDKR